MNRQEGIETVFNGPSHIVILGAGASIASTVHNPEPFGKKLPSMDNFIEVCGLDGLLGKAGIDTPHTNFETAYSVLYNQNPAAPLLKEIENAIRDYFQSLTLPNTPTIYDYLILSLRPKDLIATFNWDPFLYQAFCRNRPFCDGPRLSFLHGNVAIGFAMEDEKAGPAGWFSKATGAEFVPTKLLYPVTNKNYNADEFTRQEWERLQRELQSAKRMTIFGYGAPDTDVEAVQLMRNAWGDANERNLEQIEIIDVQEQEVVRQRWANFIHTHHYDYGTSYFDSILAQFPRRTGERFMHQFLPATPEEAFQEANPVPQYFATLEEMWGWYRPLIKAENNL